MKKIYYLLLCISGGLFAGPKKKDMNKAIYQSINEQLDNQRRNFPIEQAERMGRHMRQRLNVRYTPVEIQDVNQSARAYYNLNFTQQELRKHFETYCIKHELDYTAIPLVLRDLRMWKIASFNYCLDSIKECDEKTFKILCLMFKVTGNPSPNVYTFKHPYIDLYDPEIHNWLQQECSFANEEKNGTAIYSYYAPKDWWVK